MWGWACVWVGYGMAPNLTSWGGNAILDPATGLYHIFVSAMTNGCPLSSWGHNSRIDHGVAESITGQCTSTPPLLCCRVG
jgi:hypothetical protein